MCKKIILSLFILFIAIIPMYSQVFSFRKAINDSSKSSRINFVKFPNETSQNYLVTANLQLIPVSYGHTIGVKGLVSNVGINFARLFSRKFVLGVAVEFKIVNGIFPGKPSKAFVSDFNEMYISQYDNPKDSANAFVVKNAINTNFLGSQLGNICVMFSAFPQKYGGVLVQIKKGVSSFGINSYVYGNQYIDGGGHDHFNLGSIRNYSVELTFKPLSFFRNTYVVRGSKISKSIVNRLLVSIFYENVAFKDAEFNGTPVSKMVADDFMKKYGTDHRFGLKFGIGIY